MSHFWQKPLTLGASLVVVVGMMGLTAAAVSAHSTHATSKPKGTIIYSDYEKAPTLNPAQYNGVAAAEQDSNFAPFGIGYYFDSNGILRSGFYKNVPKPSHGGKTYTVTLRKGLKWSNGKPITNKDVVLGWHVGLNKNSGPSCAGSCDQMTSIKLKGTLGMVWNFKAPTPPDLALFQDSPIMLPYGWSGLGSGQSACLKSPPGCNAIASKIWGNQKFNYESGSYVTSGPYRIKSWSNGTLNKTQFAPNKNWKNSFVGAKNVTALKTLEYLQFASQTSMISGVASGETNASTDYTVLQLPELNAARSQCHGCFNVNTHATYDPEELFFNDYNAKVNVCGGPSNVDNPVSHLKVRQALALAYNRASMESNAYGIPLSTAEKYSSYNDIFVSTPALKNPYNDSAIKGVWDPIQNAYVQPATTQAFADARTLLHQAGFDNPTIYITTNGSGNPARKNEVDYLASNNAWGKIGVNVQYIDEEAGSLFSDWNSTTPCNHGVGPGGNYEIMIFAYTNNPPFPDGWSFETESQFCAQTDNSGSAENDENWSCIHDSTIDNAFKAMAATASESVRHTQANIISEDFSKNVYWSLLAMRPVVQTSDKHVGGASVNPFIGGEANWDPWAWHRVH